MGLDLSQAHSRLSELLVTESAVYPNLGDMDAFQSPPHTMCWTFGPHSATSMFMRSSNACCSLCCFDW